jgi:hypothetical protein
MDCVSRRHSPPRWLRYEKQGTGNSRPNEQRPLAGDPGREQGSESRESEEF